MNRAVQARIDNPDMPLYHALRIGGFNFPANEDASTLDNDKVTLGQRKNQLLRRLRQLARKQEKEESEKAQQQQQQQQATDQTQQQTTSEVTRAQGLYSHMPLALPHQPPLLAHFPPSPQQPPTDVNPLQLQLSHISNAQQHGHQGAESHTMSGTKRQAPPLLDMGLSDGGDQQTNLGKRAVPPQHQHQLDASLRSLNPNPIQQVLGHQQGVQLPPNLAAFTMGNQIMLPTEMRTLYQLGFPQDFTHQAAAFEGEKEHEHLLHRQTQRLIGSGGFFPPNVAAEQKTSETTTPFEQQQQQQHSASPVPQPPQAAGANSTEALEVAKETAALAIFQQELQTLYCRSMLAAGYSPNETTQRSPCFRRFAFNAWKQECERLQDILGDEEAESLTSPETGVGGGQHPPHASV